MTEQRDRPLKEPDPQVSCKKFWSGFQQNISRAEPILNHNMHLIAEIISNHCSQATANLPRNVVLTKELNINKVMDLYASLSHVVESLLNDQNDVDSSEDDNSPQIIEGAGPSKSPCSGDEF